MLDKLFANILDMTATGSIVIGVILLARLALKRMPKIFSYCLWTVALLRLLCPVGISAPVSVVPAVPSVSESYSLADEVIPFTDAGEAAMHAIVHVTNHNPETNLVQIQPSVATGTAPMVTCSPWEAWVLFGQYVWAAGVMGMILFSLHRLLRLRRKLLEAVHLRHNIYQVDGIATPFVMGLFRPKIYLPSDLTVAEQQYILRHEQHHIRRLDHVSKILGFIALSLHWFNPLVWLAFSLAQQDMEMSCDEAVIKKLGGDVRADYSQSLLRFSTGRAAIAGVPLAFGEGDAGRRIRNLSKWKQPARWLRVIATALCVVVLVGCAMDGPVEKTTPGSSAEVVYGSNAEQIFDIYDENVNAQETHDFLLPEYPDVLFRLEGATVYAQENGKWHRLLSAYTIYIADLNGDGKREFCGTMTVGSGIIDQRIVVYDFVDNMCYGLNQRAAYDFGLRIEDGQLVVDRYEHMGIHYGKDPLSQGTLVLKDRQLTFVSGETTVLGYRTSEHFNGAFLESIHSKIQDYESRGVHVRLLSGYAPDYYMTLPGKDFSAALITEEVDGSVWLDFGATQGVEAEARYLAFLHMITSSYYSDPDNLGYYIYQDPANPAQLFICTEIRDCGYRDIQSYYEDLTAGKCQSHPDTYIIRLDTHAIYRWGEEENLYASLDQ